MHITSWYPKFMEAILACHPALSTDWLNWVAADLVWIIYAYSDSPNSLWAGYICHYVQRSRKSAWKVLCTFGWIVDEAGRNFCTCPEIVKFYHECWTKPLEAMAVVREDPFPQVTHSHSLVFFSNQSIDPFRKKQSQVQAHQIRMDTWRMRPALRLPRPGHEHESCPHEIDSHHRIQIF